MKEENKRLEGKRSISKEQKMSEIGKDEIEKGGNEEERLEEERWKKMVIEVAFLQDQINWFLSRALFDSTVMKRVREVSEAILELKEDLTREDLRDPIREDSEE